MYEHRTLHRNRCICDWHIHLYHIYIYTHNDVYKAVSFSIEFYVCSKCWQYRMKGCFIVDLCRLFSMFLCNCIEFLIDGDTVNIFEIFLSNRIKIDSENKCGGWVEIFIINSTKTTIEYFLEFCIWIFPAFIFIIDQHWNIIGICFSKLRNNSRERDRKFRAVHSKGREREREIKIADENSVKRTASFVHCTTTCTKCFQYDFRFGFWQFTESAPSKRLECIQFSKCS